MKRRNFIKNLIAGALGLAAVPVVAKVVEPESKIGKFEDYIGGTNTGRVPAGPVDIVESNFCAPNTHYHTYTLNDYKPPIGATMAYSGDLKDIPSGYLVADGKNGTVNASNTLGISPEGHGYTQDGLTGMPTTFTGYYIQRVS